MRNITTKSSIFDIFNDIDHPATAKTITTHIPLLVLSCCNYRLNKLDNKQNFSLNSDFLFKNVNDEDFILAENIKDYFSKKLAWLKLKGKRLTKFRNDLAEFLYTDFSVKPGYYVMPESIIGMVNRLPSFYHYDLLMDELFTGDTNKYIHFVGEKVLKHVRTLERKSRQSKYFDYYFMDEDSFRYCLTISKDNCLESLLQHAMLNNDLVVNGNFSVVKNDHTYYTSNKYGLTLIKK